MCKADNRELQNSHFLPAGVYRVTREENEANPNPITFDDRGVFQDSKQICDYLLCSECEDRLNKNGERWFLADCSRRDQFRLDSLLNSGTAVELSPRMKVYHAASIPGVNVEALAYFASSMFWRSSAHRWTVRGKAAKGIQLGPYQEELRTYLLGQTEFPRYCVLWVSVADARTPIDAFSLTPYGGRTQGYHVYKLLVRGVAFHLFVGKRIPAQFRQTCFVRGTGHPIYRTDMLEEALLKDMRRKFDRVPELLNGPRGGAGARQPASE